MQQYYLVRMIIDKHAALTFEVDLHAFLLSVPNETMQRVRCFSSLLWCILVCGFFLQMECTCMARVLGMFLCTVLFG